jgi:proteasome lid subunit RPN8/RPN11
VTPIAIPHEVRAWVYAQAVVAYPAECCGYLTGPADGDAVDTAVACRNALADGGEHSIAPERGVETGFVIAGAELLRFARSFDTDHPPRIVYHSHTNGRAYFSELDRALAAGPAYPVQHLVVGIALRTVTEAAQFAWSEAERAYVEVARWKP